MPTNIEGEEFYTDRKPLVWEHIHVKAARALVKKAPKAELYEFDGGRFEGRWFRSLVRQAEQMIASRGFFVSR